MPKYNQQTTTLWQEHSPLTFPKLAEPKKTDVCIVGAGIAGLTTAYRLAKEGIHVVVVDGATVGGGQTIRTTAHICSALDDRYMSLVKMHGKNATKLIASSHKQAIQSIETIVLEEQIDCDFERVDGYLFLGPDHDQEYLLAEYNAAMKAGVEVEFMLSPRAIPFHTGSCLRFPNQAQFHPVKYVNALAQAICKMGGKIFANTHIHAMRGGENAFVEAESGLRISANSLVFATNVPVNDRVVVHTKQASYRSYVVAFELPAQSFNPLLLWDTADPYHYIRVYRDRENQRDILLVGGEDHKTGQADDYAKRYRRLKKWTKARFPMVKRVVYEWSGQIVEPVDSLAFIGHNPMDSKNVYIATGDSGNGITHGTIAGMLICDLIVGRENLWSKIYDPTRTNVHSIRKYAKENINTAMHYDTWFTPGDVSSETDIPPGCGAVVRHGLGKIAAYRDENGKLSTCSAVCTHLGGIVAWNSGEKTWDCPCHGSRFDAYGKVIDGPAIEDLSPVGIETTEVPVDQVIPQRRPDIFSNSLTTP